MEQLLIHLIADFWFQPNKMAIKKVEDTKLCLYHALIYTTIFLLLTRSPLALFIIFLSHFLIDRFRLVRYLIFAKNWIMERNLEWQKCKMTGFPNDLPSWLAFILLLVIDSSAHLVCNYLALKYL